MAAFIFQVQQVGSEWEENESEGGRELRCGWNVARVMAKRNEMEKKRNRFIYVESYALKTL